MLPQSLRGDLLAQLADARRLWQLDRSQQVAGVWLPEALARKFGNLEVIFVESGGDNLSATFSPELADLTIYVIDVAEGEKIPRKGGPGITKSDFLVINKTDLAPHVGVDLELLEADTRRARGDRPYVMARLRQGMARRGIDLAEATRWLRPNLD